MTQQNKTRSQNRRLEKENELLRFRLMKQEQEIVSIRQELTRYRNFDRITEIRYQRLIKAVVRVLAKSNPGYQFEDHPLHEIYVELAPSHKFNLQDLRREA